MPCFYAEGRLFLSFDNFHVLHQTLLVKFVSQPSQVADLKIINKLF